MRRWIPPDNGLPAEGIVRGAEDTDEDYGVALLLPAAGRRSPCGICA